MPISVSAKEVSRLRGTTGAGMMDCKKALVEASGDFDKAIELLRKRGEKISSFRADRETSEGHVAACVSQDRSRGFLLALTCETDFVARNDAFRELTSLCVQLAMAHGCTHSEEITALTHEGATLAGRIADAVGRMGEKITIGGYEVLTGEFVVPYVHMGDKLGVLVALHAEDTEEAYEAGRNVAMQVAAMNPVALNREDVPQDVIDSELAIGRELAKKEGKPESMLDKIATGRLNKFFKERTLASQPYVKDSKISVSQYLEVLSQPIRLQNFRRLAIG